MTLTEAVAIRTMQLQGVKYSPAVLEEAQAVIRASCGPSDPVRSQVAEPQPAAAFIANRNGECKLVPILVADFYPRTVKGSP